MENMFECTEDALELFVLNKTNLSLEVLISSTTKETIPSLIAQNISNMDMDIDVYITSLMDTTM